MNILYISHLTGSQYGGPNYSVPAQVSAQAKIDNVFWYNLTEPVMDHWKQTGLFHNVDEYPNRSISSLPEPFNHPDLVVFEDFYYIDDCRLGKECKKNHIPYVIVPRSALTKKAQDTKKVKKIVANALLFRPFAKSAAAIEYLTEAEKENSGCIWNKKAIVIPNGISRIPFADKQLSADSCTGVYIGRFTPAKGIDLLLDAVCQIQDYMRKAKVRISLYGPKTYEMWGQVKTQIQQKGIEDILAINDAVVGEDKDKVLKTADFFIMTSRFEGMPMGLIEALSYSLPCIVTDGTNLRNEIETENAGWGCDTDTESISTALKTLCENKNKLPEFRKNAYTLAGKYEWSAMARKAHIVYEEIIRGIENK